MIMLTSDTKIIWTSEARSLLIVNLPLYVTCMGSTGLSADEIGKYLTVIARKFNEHLGEKSGRDYADYVHVFVRDQGWEGVSEGVK